MRWMIIKKAWNLAKEAFPEAKVWVSVPFRMARKGEMEVYDLESSKPVGTINYYTSVRAAAAFISMEAKGKTTEVVIPKASPKSFRSAEASQFKQPTFAKAVDPIVKTAAARPKFHINQRVRVMDGSMDHNELGSVVDIQGSAAEGYKYAVLVDGSSKPILLIEDNLKLNMAGAEPK